MTRGGKDDRKKDKPDTPESSTTPSSAPSLTDDTRQLLSEARGRTSSHQSRSRKKKTKSVTSEPSTPPSSTPPSSELSVVDDNAPLLQSSAHASTKDSHKAVAGTGSLHSKNVPETTRGKKHLAVLDQGAVGSRSPSKSPSKSPSVFSQFKKSLVTTFSPKKKSPKRSIGSGSPSRQKTEFPGAKHKSLKESASNISEATLKEDGQNTGSSNSSGSSVKVSSDDAPQSENFQKENRLIVPGIKSVVSSPKSPKKNFLAQVREKFSPERRKHEVHSKDISSESSSKSESSSSVTSHISKKRQESNASNISSENSRSSNSKSSSISPADNKEYLRPEMMHSGEGNSGDAAENTNNGSRLSKVKCEDKERLNLVKSHLLSPRLGPFTNPMDNLYSEDESRQRSRSESTPIYLRRERFSKYHSKAQQEDGQIHETQKGATAACSVQPVRNESPGIGSNEIGVDIQGATANWSDQSVRRKNTATHGGAEPPSGEGRLDQSVRRKNTATHGGAEPPSGEGRLDQSVRRKNTATHGVANAPSGEGRLDKSERKDTTQRSGDNGSRCAEERSPNQFLDEDFFANIWQPRNSSLSQRDQASRPHSTATRHQSLSPKCEHKSVHTSNCRATTRLIEKMNQRKCNPAKLFNQTVAEVGKERLSVLNNAKELRKVRTNLSELEKEVKKTLGNLSSSREEVMEVSPSSVEEIDEYSSRLQEVRIYLRRLQENIKEIITNLNLTKLNNIKRNIWTHDRDVQDFLGAVNMNESRVPQRYFDRLVEIFENLSSFENELEEIRNNARFSLLESVPENLSRIEEDVEEIRQNLNLPSLNLALYYLSRMQQILEPILKEVKKTNEQVPSRK